MPIINRVADYADEITAWRHDLHEHPELLYDVHRTAAFVAEKLKGFGCDMVVSGIGRTGVVGIIHGRKRTSGRAVGLRADMDALPILEATGKPYASKTPGKMHACGHDGHTAMLLGAARYLCETRNFDGDAVLIFQPAEEGGAGARAMIEDGLLDRFGISEVYGMHTMPGVALGAFAIRPGPFMAAADEFAIMIEGRGGHAAMPQHTIDPVVVGAAIVTALQTIVSRETDPAAACVLTITRFHAGEALNVIAPHAELGGTVRALDETVRKTTVARLKAMAEGIAAAHRATATFDYKPGYPVTVNDEEAVRHAVEAARAVAGTDKVNAAAVPLMGAEDFSFMLQKRPGAYIFLGNGDSAGLHHPAFDFSDEAAPYGVSYLVRLLEDRLPIRVQMA